MGFETILSGLVWEAYFVQTGVIDFSEFCSARTKDIILICGILFAAGLACVAVVMCNKRSRNNSGGGRAPQQAQMKPVGMQMQQGNPMQAQATAVPVAQAHY